MSNNTPHCPWTLHSPFWGFLEKLFSNWQTLLWETTRSVHKKTSASSLLVLLMLFGNTESTQYWSWIISWINSMNYVFSYFQSWLVSMSLMGLIGRVSCIILWYNVTCNLQTHTWSALSYKTLTMFHNIKKKKAK